MKYLINKEVDYSQDPNGVHMFEVSWFNELMEVYNSILIDVLLSSAKKGDIIRIYNKFLPHLMDMVKKTSEKERITTDMKAYIADRITFRLSEVIDELRSNGHSAQETDFINREINQVQILLNV